MRGDPVRSKGLPRAEWVIMYYFQGDNNISRDTIYKAARIETVGSSDELVTVVLTGEPKGTPYEGVRMFKAERRDDQPDPSNPIIHSKPFYVSKEENASSPETLKRFILETMRRFPAKHYALVMMDHGFGFLGGMDDSKGRYMDIRDMERVLQEVRRETGKGIDVLGFDACLMAQLEVAKQFVGEVRYLVASQDLEHPYGWEEHAVIKEIMDRLEREGSLTPERVALIMGEVNSKYPEAMKTISVLDLSKVDGLLKSLDALAVELMKIPLEDLRDLMRRTPHMCHYFPDDKLCTNYRDLRTFLRNVEAYAKERGEHEMLRLARRAQKALDEVIMFSWNSGEEVYKGNLGLSAYLPPNGMLTKYYRTYEKVGSQWSSDDKESPRHKGVYQNPKQIWMALRIAEEAPNWRKLMESLGEDDGEVSQG